MQRQNSGQKTQMLLQKFGRSRQLANTPKTQRAQQVAAVVALANAVLSKADTPKPKRGRAPGDRFTKIEGFDANSLGAILRARLANKA